MKAPLRVVLTLAVVAAAFTAGMVLQKDRNAGSPSGESRPGRFQAVTKFIVLPRADQAPGDSWMKNQVVIIGCREVVLRAVNRLHLDQQWNVNPDEAAARVEAKIAVERVKDTNVVTVTASDNNPATAAEIANAVREGYGEFRAAMEQENVSRVQQHLTAKVKAQESEVESRRKEMIELANNYNISDIVPLAAGASHDPGIRGCPPITVEGFQHSLQLMESDLRKMEAQANALKHLEGTKLVAAVKELGIFSAAFDKVNPEYHYQFSVLTQLQEHGVKDDDPKIAAVKKTMEEQSKQLEKIAESCRVDLARRIESGWKRLGDDKKRLPEMAAASTADRQRQSEYAVAKQRYEAALILLNNVKEQAARQKNGQGIPASAVETLETAKPPSP